MRRLAKEINETMRTVMCTILMVFTSYQVFGQTAATPPAFEVASVKPNTSGDRSLFRFATSRGDITATNVTLQFLIMHACAVRNDQISGGPNWLNSERYDVVTKQPSSDRTPARTMQMLQTLLADRFQLRLNRETKEFPIYALVVGKNGPKLHEPEDLAPNMMSGRGRITAHKVSIEEFAKRLGGQLGRTVVDRTGLQGNFAFDLEWTPDPDQEIGPPNPTPAESSGPSVFTALQEQLGLKLEAKRGQVEILVVDHAERPSEN